MTKLIIEIFKENESIDTRTIPANEKRGELKLYSQVAYAHLGGKFPVETSISLEEGQPAYIAGKYELHQSSFQVGNYDRLEFSRKIVLVPLGKDF
ncbi:single-stranded DNA-binding protein [Photobacterium leiognathi]|uniref:single-stranded DNA-binding protein n=1 Tax=Photobacterium leiognathi TaxID=553611 RepID=UPI00273A3CC4|nr:single-stranded DNA-binding protein [Photobacterium leiognathi]